MGDTPIEEFEGLFKRLEEEFKPEELTKENIKDFIGRGKGRTELAGEITKAQKLSQKIEEAPSKEKLKELRSEIRSLPFKKELLREKAKERKKELTPVEGFAREREIRLSKYKIGRLENWKDGTSWIVIRSGRKATRGRMITRKRVG